MTEQSAQSKAEVAKPKKCGFIAIVGAPNAGKSTLVNAFVGQPFSIVTHKAQTTRFSLRGVMHHDETQLVLIDTPGLFQGKNKLDRKMIASALRAINEADMVLHIVDAKNAASRFAKNQSVENCVTKAELNALESIDGRPCFLALNKIDLLSHEQLLPLTEKFWSSEHYQEIIPVSARTTSGLERLKNILLEQAPEGPWHFDAEQISDLSEKLLAAEITRKQLFLRLGQELPYSVHVETIRLESSRGGAVRIEQLIHVERASQKAIIVGRAGAGIKEIGSRARAEMRSLFNKKVHLFLSVRHTAGWSSDPRLLADIGLD